VSEVQGQSDEDSVDTIPIPGAPPGLKPISVASEQLDLLLWVCCRRIPSTYSVDVFRRRIPQVGAVKQSSSGDSKDNGGAIQALPNAGRRRRGGRGAARVSPAWGIQDSVDTIPIPGAPPGLKPISVASEQLDSVDTIPIPGAPPGLKPISVASEQLDLLLWVCCRRIPLFYLCARAQCSLVVAFQIINQYLLQMLG
jgi:hypothetical protein